MTTSRHEDLVIWQRAMDLVERVYRLSTAFPDGERYGLTAQIRRAAVSIPSNIAEGNGRLTPAELRYFLGIARGSLREVETQARIAQRLGFCADDAAQSSVIACQDLARILNKFLAAQESKPQPGRASARRAARSQSASADTQPFSVLSSGNNP